jgi:hypothetical protein
VGKTPYHAGRFFINERIVVDPVRAFMKHFTRLADTNVNVDDLYQSYLSRNTVYTEEDLRILYPAALSMYPDLTVEHADVIMRTVAHLRERSFFNRTQTPQKQVTWAVDAPVDCAVAVAKHVFPGRPARFYHQFRGGTRDQLANVFNNLGVSVTLCERMSEVPQGVPGVVISFDHCRWSRARTNDL